MSPRPKRKRKLLRLPFGQGFGPIGLDLEGRDRVRLLLEEYEAIRLVDYLNLSHEEAAGLMDVSRPTFTRIYDKARKKMGQFLIENSVLEFSGGDVELDNEWRHCSSCRNYGSQSRKCIESSDFNIVCDHCSVELNKSFPVQEEREEVFVVPCTKLSSSSKVSKSFAHCNSFALVGTKEMDVIFYKNPFYQLESCPAGGLLKFFREWKVKTVYVREIGRNSLDVFAQSNIQISYLPEGVSEFDDVLSFIKEECKKEV
ncbi:MAG: DUF134 domain-containing protein [Bacteroidales bacterium]